MYKPLILPIYCHDDDSKLLNDLGVEKPIQEHDLNDMAFFTIDAIEPIEDEKGDYCILYCGNSSFCTPYPLSKLLEIIEAWQQ